MSLNTDKIQGIIWDLDNTLYRFTEAFYQSCTMAAAKAAQEHGIDLSFDETLKLAERSEQEYGYSMHGYVVHHGISYADLHFPFHDKIDESVIEKIEELPIALQSINTPQVILTNASRGWAKRVLEYTGLNQFFDDAAIIPMEDADFEPKARSHKGFKLAQEKLKLPFENIVMVDDLDRNLIIPHKLGMQTAYMHHGGPIDFSDKKTAPPYITAQFSDSVEFITNLINQ